MAERRSEVSEDAKDDLAAQYAWYAGKAGPDVAERYLTAFRHTTRRLVAQADLGMLRRFQHPQLNGIRSLPLDGAFRSHLLFYRLEREVVVVFRVLHGMRDLPRRLLEPPQSDR
jgi:plasmid stabilization system protein ParE